MGEDKKCRVCGKSKDKMWRVRFSPDKYECDYCYKTDQHEKRTGV